MSRVTVLGSGAWGSTMAQVLCDAGQEVMIWGRNREIVDEINVFHTNEKFLPDISLPSQLIASEDIAQAFAFAETVVVAIPAQTLRGNLQSWKGIFPHHAPIISTLKGIEAVTHVRMTDVIKDVLGTPAELIGLITGPNLAGELALRQPAGAVAASESVVISELMIELFTTPYFRVYPSSDLIGCELAGAVKSVIALAVGLVLGLEYGENTQAMIITRGLSEVARFGDAYGANPLTFLGLAGMGDLVASCGSPLSRNRTFGEILGRTGSIEEAMRQVSKTVEAVASAGPILELAHAVGVEVPIIEAVADVVAGTLSPVDAMTRLMTINLKAEI